MHNEFKLHAAKYCMSCNNVEPVDITILLNESSRFSNLSRNFTADVYDNNTDHLLSTECNACGSEYTVIIDTNISKIIGKLGEKGYITRFSCDGICDDDGISLPYISFVSNVTPIDIFDTLPDGWSVTLNADFDRLSGKCISMYYDEYESNTNWDADALLKWADSLPDNTIGYGITKKPGEKYCIDDIRKTFEHYGYKIIKFDIRQNDEDPSIRICITFKEPFMGLRYVMAPYSLDGTEYTIALANSRTDVIHNTVLTIRNELDRRLNKK